MKRINEYIRKEFDGNACDFYRSLVTWMDYRNEHLNQGKSFRALALEYIEYLEN